MNYKYNTLKSLLLLFFIIVCLGRSFTQNTNDFVYNDRVFNLQTNSLYSPISGSIRKNGMGYELFNGDIKIGGGSYGSTFRGFAYFRTPIEVGAIVTNLTLQISVNEIAGNGHSVMLKELGSATPDDSRTFYDFIDHSISDTYAQGSYLSSYSTMNIKLNNDAIDDMFGGNLGIGFRFQNESINDGIFDGKNARFEPRLIADYFLPLVMITTPTQGEKVEKGSYHNITWNYNIPDTYNDYVWLILKSPEGDIWLNEGKAVPNNGLFRWEVSESIKDGKQYWIDVKSKSFHNIRHNTKDYFEILSKRELNVTPSKLTLGSSSGSSETFAISSNTSWSVSESVSWLNVSSNSGSGNRTITVTATSTNPSTTTGRVASISVSGGGINRTVTVSQEPSVALTVSPTSLTLGSSSGSSETFTISSNTSWTVSESSSWLNVSSNSGSGNRTITVTATSANPSTTTRRTGSISVSGGGINRTVTVSQEPSVVIFGATPNSKTVSATSGSTTFSVTSSVGWSVEDNVPWLAATKIDGTIISVVYQANTSPTSRSATITVYGTGGLKDAVTVTQEGTDNNTCSSYAITDNTYSESVNLLESVRVDLGEEYTIADWTDLKNIKNIDEWVSCMNLQHDQTFMVKMNGNRFFNSTRQYLVQYSTDGIPYAGFLVHDQIDNKLFLGSWYGINMHILARNDNHTDINDESFSNIVVYPNPTNEKVFINLSNNVKYTVMIKLLDNTGRILFLDRLNSLTVEDNYSLNLSSFSPGIYLIRIESNKGVIVKKVIKK